MRNRELLEPAAEFLRLHARTDEVLVLAEVKHAADDLVRAYAGDAVAGVHRHSPRDLASELAADRILAAGLAPVTRLGREALAARVAHQAELRDFAPVAAMRGFATALARTLNDLRLAAVSGLDGELGLLLRLYEQELCERRLADRAARFEIAAEVVEQGAHPLVGKPAIVFDLAPRPALERRLVEAVVRRAPASLVLGRTESPPQGRAPRPESLPHLEIFSASGEALECVEIARRVMGSGLPFDSIAVLMRSPARYGQHLREAFRRAGIPGYFTRAAARPDPVGRAFLALCIGDLEEYLSLGQKAAPATCTLPASARWGQWLEVLHDLADAALDQPDGVHDALDELEPMAEVGPVDLAGVTRVLADRLRFLYPDPPATRYGGVFAGAIQDARGMSFRAVFVPGLNEGAFPARWNEDPLLSDASRAALGMQTAESDRELFHAAIATASERLTLSYSSIDLLNGRERVPSSYVFDAYEAAHGVAADVRKLQREARASVATRAGWPAPAAAEDAIDDAEFDLAALRGATEPGAGAYLLDASPHLVRALRARWKRWAQRWSDADGLITDIGGLPGLRLRERAYSPTSLEEYAACPYRFALRALYRLRPMERAVQPQRMDPLVRGKLFHEVVAEVLRGGELDEALDRIAAGYSERLAPAIPAVWQAEVERMRADLRGWIRQRSAEQGWTPLHVEWEFEVEVEGYRLKGAVDLIEAHASGALRAVDHKTGAPPQPRPEWIGGGETLQPVLYALAAENALGGKVAGGRLSYATARQNYRTIDVPLNDIARASARTVLQEIDEALADGFLPAAPRERACEGCDYRCVCGPYEEERTRRKPRLKALAGIRRTR